MSSQDGGFVEMLKYIHVLSNNFECIFVDILVNVCVCDM